MEWLFSDQLCNSGTNGFIIGRSTLRKLRGTANHLLYSWTSCKANQPQEQPSLKHLVRNLTTSKSSQQTADSSDLTSVLSDKAGKDNTHNSKYRALTTKNPIRYAQGLEETTSCFANLILLPALPLMKACFLSSLMATIVYVPSFFSSLYPSSHFHLTGNKIPIPHFSHLFFFLLAQSLHKKRDGQVKDINKRRTRKD